MLTVTKPQNATLIDSISEGYAAINRRPWLLLVPILLNIYLWFGAPLSLGPLIDNFVALMRGLQPANAAGSDLQPMYDQLLSRGGTDLRQQLAVLNFIPTLQLRVVGSFGDGIPTAAEILQPIDGASAIQISTLGGALLAFVLINVLALALSSVFLAQLGAAVQRELPAAAAGPRRVLRIGLSILGSLGVIAGVALALGLPILFFAALLLLVNQTLGLLAIELLFAVGFWISIYIGFYAEATVVGGAGPLRAIYTSFNVVRRNFWGTLGFLVLSFIITLGSGVIWTRLIGSTAGLIVAIVGSAYIGQRPAGRAHGLLPRAAAPLAGRARARSPRKVIDDRGLGKAKPSPNPCLFYSLVEE
jgi:hypothetical protein